MSETTKRFTECVVVRDVYVNSLSQAFITVILRGRVREWLTLSVFGIEYEKRPFTTVRLPKYAYKLISDALKHFINGSERGGDSFIMYECDRDGNHRYNNLRYDPPIEEVHKIALYWAEKFSC